MRAADVLMDMLHLSRNLSNSALWLYFALLPVAAGCSGSSPSGGEPGVGGSANVGGAPSGGGSSVVTTGGTRTVNSESTGGSSSPLPTGGASSAGGTSAHVAGGATTGGAPATGGASAGATGGISSSGGVASSGGAPVTGGSSAKGGSVAVGGGVTGGKSATGGAATGGAATGGKSTTGGAATGGKSATGGAANGGSGNAATGTPEAKPSGYGQSTTGCGSTNYQDAATMAAIQSLIDAYSGTGGLCIRYTGKFDFASIPDPCTQHTLAAQTVEIKRKGSITIMGADGSAANFGIHVASTSSNIIIRNMTFGLLPGGGSSDAISVEGMSDGAPNNLWIDHNELFSSMVECAGAGDTSFDGLIDLKKGADNVTVSYNYIHDHHKVSLNGYTDDDDLVRHITYHHNIFENVGSRTPLQRHGYSHVLSNYLNNVTTSGANIRMGGYSLIESNYFENCKNPVTSRDSSALGYWDLRDNNIKSPSDFTTYNITWSASTSTPTKDATDWTTTAAFPVALGYTYTADPPACLKSGLRAAAGAGKGLVTLKCN